MWDWSCRSSLVRTEKAARLVTQPIINLVPGRLRQREKKIKDQPRLHRETLFKKKSLEDFFCVFTIFTIRARFDSVHF